MRYIILYDNIIVFTKEKFMNLILNFIQKCLIFEKEPQKIGLCQLKEATDLPKKKEVSIKNKDVKLSDLMRRAS
jgi:hypothetical protein